MRACAGHVETLRASTSASTSASTRAFTTSRSTLLRLAAACAFALLLCFPESAYAHATLLSSEPAAGSRLSTRPSRVRLTFDEPIEADLCQIVIVSADGHTTTLAVSADPRDVRGIVAPLDLTADGAYRVAWRVISADGHPVEGSLVFDVGSAVDRVPPAAELVRGTAAWGPQIAAAPLIPVLLRWLAIGTTMALGGLLFFFAWTRESLASRRGRATMWLAIAAPVFLAAHLIAWIINASPDHTFSAAWAMSVLGTPVGQIELWRTGLALMALWAYGLARRPRLALAFAVAALAASGAVGHSAAIRPALAIPLKAVHILAASAWLGGLLWLVLWKRNGSQKKDGGSDADVVSFRADASRVSSAALIAVIVVALTGLGEALLFIPSPLDLIRSAYGLAVLGKIAGLAVLVGFGAYHRLRVLPSLRSSHGSGSQPLRSSVRIEVGVMCLVLLLAAFLAYLPPPHSASAGRQFSSQIT